MEPFVEIDGSQGEGGGQVLRTCLALSVVTGRPVRIRKIRAGRDRPGLARQHLTAVRAAAAISGAAVSGDHPGSMTLTFTPRRVHAGLYRFVVGTAGSTALVLQTVLWPLLLAESDSEVVVEGGTHNPLAPPFECMQRALVPLLRRMGAEVELELERAGFYPAGGGRIRARIGGRTRWLPLELLQRGAVERQSGRAIVANLSFEIARREIEEVHARLGWPRRCLVAERVVADGPGNAVLLEVETPSSMTVVCAVGRRGISAEQVAGAACAEMARFLDADVVIDAHLADQLLLPMALGQGGAFTTPPPTAHTRTNAAIITSFLGTQVELEPLSSARTMIRVTSDEASTDRAHGVDAQGWRP